MKNGDIIFPRAFAFAIDDLGWNEGGNLSQKGGPFRVGVKRRLNLDDYRHIIEVGQAVGARIQSLFILSEMDRENVLARYPSTTYMRSRWDNSQRVCDEQVEIMNYVVGEAAHMEFGFHGTGHEYWPEENVARRAEWYNMIDRHPWPEDDLRRHIQAFRDILAQYGLTPEHGHSFPESFVPCAYSYYWNPEGDYSLGKLLAEAGVKYANTDFAQIPELSPPQESNGGGFDHGVHVINRMNFGNLWHELATLPKLTLDMQVTDIIESHWPNWLAPDDFLQNDVTKEWISYYRQVQRYPSRYVAKNTEQLHSQWLYKKYAVVRQTGEGTVEIDNTGMPAEAYQRDLLGNLVFKIPCTPGMRVEEATINGAPIPAYFHDQGYEFLYLPPLDEQKYTLSYRMGSHEMSDCVCNDGTYNCYAVERKEDKLRISLKMYGRQTVKVRCKAPGQVVSLSPGLKVNGFRYHASSQTAAIDLSAADFQGTRGNLIIQF